MKLQLTAVSGSNLLRLVGDLDLYGTEDAREAVLNHLADKSGLDLDLAGVETCDTAGLQLVLAARRSAAASGKTFSVLTRSFAVEQCAQLLGLSPQAWPSDAA